MNRALAALIVAPLLAVSACAGGGRVAGDEPPAEARAALAAPSTAPLGRSVRIDGTALRVSFTGVLEDGRCPADVLCVWQGNARVALVIAVPDRADTALVLNTGVEPTRAEVAGYRVHLEELLPYPIAGAPADPRAYRARLRVERP
jgi:hypothetical protein